jgi:thiol-disulfide isomerase/thioredoxin
MVFVPWFRRSILLMLVAFVSVGWMQAQVQFTGKLDPGLHLDPMLMGPVMFNPISANDAKLLRVSVKPGDKIFTGELALPKGGALHYKTMIVRSSDGADVLYVDANQDGHFGPNERIPFRLPAKVVPHLKSVAAFDVDLPTGPFHTCPMVVWLVNDDVPSPARPGQLAVGYDPTPFVQGQVQLPKRTLMVRFQYDFNTQGVSLVDGREWLDINGDGKFDMTPGSGEFLRARGSAPVFQVGNLTLQVQSVDLKDNRFVVRSVAASAYHRIHLAVGSVIPDFEFTDFSGARQHLSDVKGRFILLNFWATWCVPCMEDLPILKKTYAEFHGQGFEILGMNDDQTPEKPESVVRQLGISWPQAQFDKNLIEDRFQISQWPTMILIDEHRTILSMGEANHLPLDGEHLPTTLTAVMGKRP